MEPDVYELLETFVYAPMMDTLQGRFERLWPSEEVFEQARALLEARGE